MKKLILLGLIAICIKLVYVFFAWFIGFQPDLEIFKRNDSYWYETISINGHSKITPDQLGSCKETELKQSYYAFFPLYPVIIGVTMQLTEIQFSGVAFFYSLLFSFLLYLIFYRFIKEFSKSETIALNSTLILLLFPFHYYFSVYYTEALFLLLLVGAFYSIALKKMIWFSVLASLLVLVRPNGLFMLLPLLLFYLERNHINSISKSFKFIVKELSTVIYFAIPVFVLVFYCIYLKVMTGDFFAYKTAQAGWCRETVFPWVPILRSSNWMDYFNSGYLLVFMAVAVLNFKKIPFSFSTLVWMSLLLPLTANSITSPRFISVVFVFSFIFGKLLSRANPYLNFVIFVIMFLLQLYTFQFWLNDSRFSF